MPATLTVEDFGRLLLAIAATRSAQAAALGVSEGALYHYLAGRRPVPPPIVLLARHLAE